MPKMNKKRSGTSGSFARYLRRLRGDRKLLAISMDADGVSVSYISDLETGAKTNPSTEKLLKLADVYGVSPIEMLARARKVTTRMIYPGISEHAEGEKKAEGEIVQRRLRNALRDPLFEELVVEEFQRASQRLPEDEAWTAAVRGAQIRLNNSYVINYMSAIGDGTLRWTGPARRKKRSTPDEAKYLIAELHWRLRRCQTMYRTLHKAYLKRKPPENWV